MDTHYPDNVPENCMAQSYIMHVIVRSRKEERRGADRQIPTQFWKGKKGFLFPYQYLTVRYGEQKLNDYNDEINIISPTPPPTKKIMVKSFMTKIIFSIYITINFYFFLFPAN